MIVVAHGRRIELGNTCVVGLSTTGRRTSISIQKVSIVTDLRITKISVTAERLTAVGKKVKKKAR